MKKKKLNMNIKKNYFIAALFITILMFMSPIMISTGIVHAEGEEDQNNSRKEITVEVIEDIPAADIEEAPIPLAALPSSPLSNGVRHIGLMLLLLIGAILYAVYFIRYEKRLVLLRQQAAEAEARAMRKRRKTSKRRE